MRPIAPPVLGGCDGVDGVCAKGSAKRPVRAKHEGMCGEAAGRHGLFKPQRHALSVPELTGPPRRTACTRARDQTPP